MTTTDMPAPAPGAATIHPRMADKRPFIGGDQRRVGFWFGVTGLVLFTLMAVIGLVMRMAQGEMIPVNDEWFYRLMTLHAAGMLAGVLVAMMGGLWYVVRSTVPGLSFRVAMGVLVTLLAGVVLVLVSVVVGGFAGAWTFLYPLPFDSAGMWPLWAAVVFFIGMSLVGFAFMVYCIDVLKSVTETYGGLAGALGLRWLRGRADTAPPTQAIAATAVALQGIMASAAGMTMMAALLDHSIDDTTVINPLWAKNVTYFFGHSVANLVIYLAAGMLYALVPMYAGRPWKTSKPLVIGWQATIVFVMTAYAHHLYMDFVQPGALHAMGMIASSAAALPVAVVTIYTGMMLIWGSQFRWTLSSVLFFLGFVGWAFGGVGAVMDSLIPINFRFHNTLWVPAHFHSYLLMGVALWVIGLVAYLLERACDRPAGRFTTVWGPVLMVGGGYVLMFAWYISGAMGVPRRWSVHPENTRVWSVIGSLAAIVFLAGLFVVLAEMARMGREAWRRRGTAAAAEPGPVAFAALPGGGFRPMVMTYRGTVIAVAMGVAALFVLYPPINEMSELNDKYHHLAHATQFFAGAMLGAVLGTHPRVFDRFRGRISTSLVVVAIAPVIMLLVMIPQIYKNLDDRPVLHAGYHLLMIAFGVVTGLACSRLGRVAGWTVLVASVAMAVLFAPGVSGG